MLRLRTFSKKVKGKKKGKRRQETGEEPNLKPLAGIPSAPGKQSALSGEALNKNTFDVHLIHVPALFPA